MRLSLKAYTICIYIYIYIYMYVCTLAQYQNQILAARLSRARDALFQQPFPTHSTGQHLNHGTLHTHNVEDHHRRDPDHRGRRRSGSGGRVAMAMIRHVVAAGSVRVRGDVERTKPYSKRERARRQQTTRRRGKKSGKITKAATS